MRSSRVILTPAKTHGWLIIRRSSARTRRIYNAILESIEIIDGKSKDKTANALPSILSDALSVSFDTNIGHDYLYDAESRFESYHKVEDRLPFDLEGFNKVTNGGIPRKTLNVIMAGTNVGKSLFMCHHAAHCYSQGKNVLYITCEMAEERIAERIDANLMDITLDDLKILTKKVYEKKLMRVTENIKSRLIVKEYPTATANAQHFRNLLDELRLKKKFTPDIIFIDYINICASSRFKAGPTSTHTRSSKRSQKNFVASRSSMMFQSLLRHRRIGQAFQATMLVSKIPASRLVCHKLLTSCLP